MMTLLSHPAIGAPKYVSSGAGDSSCVEFAEQYKKHKEAMEIFYFSWAQGYLSAHNSWLHYTKRKTLDLNAVPQDNQKQHIRSYCSNNPLKDYVDAVISLFHFIRSHEPKTKHKKVPNREKTKDLTHS